MSVARGDHQSATGRQDREEQARKQVVSEVVDRERRFEPIGGPLSRFPILRARVQHQHVDRRGPESLLHRLGKCADAYE